MPHTHTGDGGDDLTQAEAECDVADFVSRYACVQEDVKREGTDLGKRTKCCVIFDSVAGTTQVRREGSASVLTADMPESWLQQ